MFHNLNQYTHKVRANFILLPIYLRTYLPVFFRSFGAALNMADRDFDYLFPQAKANLVELWGFVWKVILDPSHKDDKPDIFFGRLIRMIDIWLNQDERFSRLQGIVFENVTSRWRLTFQDGLLMKLANSKVIWKTAAKSVTNEKWWYKRLWNSTNLISIIYILKKREILTGV